MTENKLSPENAEKVLSILFEYYDVYAEKDDIDDEKSIKSIRKTLLKAIQRGNLNIEEAGTSIKITQTLKNGDILEYKEVDGYARREAVKPENAVDRIYSFAGYLTGRPDSDMAGLKNKDLNTMEKLVSVFLFDA